MTDDIVDTLYNYLRRDNRATIQNIQTLINYLNIYSADAGIPLDIHVSWYYRDDYGIYKRLSKEEWKERLGEILVDKCIFDNNPHHINSPQEQGSVNSRYYESINSIFYDEYSESEEEYSEEEYNITPLTDEEFNRYFTYYKSHPHYLFGEALDPRTMTFFERFPTN